MTLRLVLIVIGELGLDLRVVLRLCIHDVVVHLAIEDGGFQSELLLSWSLFLQSGLGQLNGTILVTQSVAGMVDSLSQQVHHVLGRRRMLRQLPLLCALLTQQIVRVDQVFLFHEGVVLNLTLNQVSLLVCLARWWLACSSLLVSSRLVLS